MSERAIIRTIIVPGTSVRIASDGGAIFRERDWRSREHVHIGSNSERKTRGGRVVRYLESLSDGQVLSIKGIQKEDQGKGFPF